MLSIKGASGRVQRMRVPACHGSPDCVPWVLFGLELVVGGCPGLFQGSQLLGGPGMDEAVDGSDVVDNDLVSGINVLFVMEIVSCQVGLHCDGPGAWPWLAGGRCGSGVLSLVLPHPIGLLVGCLLYGVVT